READRQRVLLLDRLLDGGAAGGRLHQANEIAAAAWRKNTAEIAAPMGRAVLRRRHLVQAPHHEGFEGTRSPEIVLLVRRESIQEVAFELARSGSRGRARFRTNRPAHARSSVRVCVEIAADGLFRPSTRTTEPKRVIAARIVRDERQRRSRYFDDGRSLDDAALRAWKAKPQRVELGTGEPRDELELDGLRREPRDERSRAKVDERPLGVVRDRCDGERLVVRFRPWDGS